MTAQRTRHLRWPAEKFYFAVLDGSGLRRLPRVPARELGYLFEPLVPQPLDELHAVFVRLPRNRYLACGVPLDLLAAVPNDVLTLTPEVLPPVVGEDVDLANVNLLTGAFTPRSVQRARRLLGWQAVGWLAIAALLVCLGLRQRTRAMIAERLELADQTLLAYQQALGPNLQGRTLPPPLQLAAELRTLEQTRAANLPVDAVRDASTTLGALFACWPADLNAETDSIQVTADAVHVQGLVPSSDDAQRWASSFSEVAGFRLTHPAVHAAGKGVRATIKLERGADP